MEIDKIGAANAGQPLGSATQAQAQAMDEAYQADSFSRLVGDAIEKAVNRPAYGADAGQGVGQPDPSDEVIRSEKMSMLSDVERPGAEPKPVETQDVQQQTEDRLRSLYVDLTNYQIAWKIAQRVQQDTSQLLRGN